MGMELRQALQIPNTPCSYDYEYEIENNTSWMTSGNLTGETSLNPRGGFPGSAEIQQNVQEQEAYNRDCRRCWRGGEARAQDTLPILPRDEQIGGWQAPIIRGKVISVNPSTNDRRGDRFSGPGYIPEQPAGEPDGKAADAPPHYSQKHQDKERIRQVDSRLYTPWHQQQRQAIAGHYNKGEEATGATRHHQEVMVSGWAAPAYRSTPMQEVAPPPMAEEIGTGRSKKRFVDEDSSPISPGTLPCPPQDDRDLMSRVTQIIQELQNKNSQRGKDDQGIETRKGQKGGNGGKEAATGKGVERGTRGREGATYNIPISAGNQPWAILDKGNSKDVRNKERIAVESTICPPLGRPITYPLGPQPTSSNREKEEGGEGHSEGRYGKSYLEVATRGNQESHRTKDSGPSRQDQTARNSNPLSRTPLVAPHPTMQGYRGPAMSVATKGQETFEETTHGAEPRNSVVDNSTRIMGAALAAF